MNKHLVICCTILLAIILSSCAAAYPTSSPVADTPQQTSSSMDFTPVSSVDTSEPTIPTVPTTPPTTTTVRVPGTTYSIICMERPTIFFESLDAFLQHVETVGLADKMVMYENLSIIGSFDSIFLLEESWDYHAEIGWCVFDPSRYVYFLNDPLGYYFGMTVEENFVPDSEMTTETVLMPADMDPLDLRSIQKAVSAKYTYQGITYSYSKGELYSVSWFVGDTKFSLDCTGGLYNYPLTENTIISRLLQQETAEAAVAEIGIPKDKT